MQVELSYSIRFKIFSVIVCLFAGVLGNIFIISVLGIFLEKLFLLWGIFFPWSIGGSIVIVVKRRYCLERNRTVQYLD